MSEEVWKDVHGYEGFYQVSSLGNVKSLKRVVVNKRGNNKIIPEKLLKLKPNSSGYIMVSLSKNGKEEHIGVHRIVAEAFIENDDPITKNVTNHINEDKTDNRVENLEWASQSYNMKYRSVVSRMNETRVSRGSINSPKKVAMCNMNGVIIAVYESISDAARRSGISSSGISYCCNGKYRSCCGYKWKFV